ncbi:MAG: hypothetical protein RSD28_07140, partial [Lachnospiraceae bacterium]
NCGEETAAQIDKEVMRILKESYETAKSLLKENRTVLDEIADYLYEHENINGKEFMKIFRKLKGIPEPEEEKTEAEKTANEFKAEKLSEHKEKLEERLEEAITANQEKLQTESTMILQDKTTELAEEIGVEPIDTKSIAAKLNELSALEVDTVKITKLEAAQQELKAIKTREIQPEVKCLEEAETQLENVGLETEEIPLEVKETNTIEFQENRV